MNRVRQSVLPDGPRGERDLSLAGPHVNALDLAAGAARVYRNGNVPANSLAGRPSRATYHRLAPEMEARTSSLR